MAIGYRNVSLMEHYWFTWFLHQPFVLLKHFKQDTDPQFAPNACWDSITVTLNRYVRGKKMIGIEIGKK